MSHRAGPRIPSRSHLLGNPFPCFIVSPPQRGPNKSAQGRAQRRPEFPTPSKRNLEGAVHPRHLNRLEGMRSIHNNPVNPAAPISNPRKSTRKITTSSPCGLTPPIKREHPAPLTSGRMSILSTKNSLPSSTESSRTSPKSPVAECPKVPMACRLLPHLDGSRTGSPPAEPGKCPGRTTPAH